VRDATVGLGPEARRAGVELRASVDADVELRLLAGGDHVVQVLTNLILNAIAASPKGGVITVTAASANREAVDADDVEITVTDEGPGVPEPLRGVLFEGGRSLRPGGAGIGLRHANDLAKSVGGALSLADTPRGARFSVRWPTCGIESVPPETRPLSRPSPLSGMRVLVVEDDEAVTELLDTALSARGAVVTSIRTHGELAGALRGGAFDVALFDISPIQDDPSGALEAVLEENPKAKLVLISGSTLSPPETRRGVHPAWVRKPFEIREIVDALLAE
jgi:CheY-like chemotaxis protein